MTSRADESAPVAAPDEGAAEYWPFPDVGSRTSFVSGGPSGRRLRIAYFRRPGDARLLGRAWFGPETVGPPGHAHGGSIAAVMDEALGAAAWAAGHPVLVARLAVDFRAMVPLGTDARFESWVERVDGRKIVTRGRLLDERGGVYAEGEALCITLAQEHIDIFDKVSDSRS